MTASNINVGDFINILSSIWENGGRYIDLDIVPNEETPGTNKIVIHPPPNLQNSANNEPVSESQDIEDPKISTANNDIFDVLNSLI